MEMTYKVGDKVRVKQHLLTNRSYCDESGLRDCLFVSGMKHYRGSVVEITEVDEEYYRYRIKGSTYYWACDMFEGLASECDTKIVIYCKGKDVIAKNTKTGETAKATCHPDDPFDFNIGAKLAFERLMNPIKIVKQDKYAVGDRVKFRSDLVLNKRYGNLDWLITMDRTMKGKEVTVCYISEDGFIKVKEDGICFYYDPTMFEGKVVSVEELKKAEPKLYNGKVVCVDNTANTTSLTVGKIYEFVDGQFKDNEGTLRPFLTSVHNLDEFHKCGCFAKFIEVVE